MSQHQSPHDLNAVRADVEALLAFVRSRLDRGDLLQRDLERGVNHVTVWKILNGKSARPETLRRIAVAGGAPAVLRDQAVRAAELLHFHALSQARRTRPPRAPAPLPAPPQPVPAAPSGRTYTEGGLRFAKHVYGSYGTRVRFCRETKTKPETLDHTFFDPSFLPRRAMVARIATMSKKLPEPVTEADVRAWFGGHTWEDAHVVRSPPCPVCGRPLPGPRSRYKTCGYGCDAIRRMMLDAIETALGRRLVVLMAAAADVPTERIALLPLEASEKMITDWIDHSRALVETVRRETAKRPSLEHAMAHVLGIRIDTLRGLIHHRTRHIDKRRPVPPTFMRKKTLACLVNGLNLSEDEILDESRRGTMSDFYKAHGPRASVQRFHLTEKGPRLRPAMHRASQIIFRAAWRGDPLREIREALDNAGLPGSDDPLGAAVRHARSCRPCRALACAYLHERRGKTLAELGQLFECTWRHGARLVADGRRAISA